MELFSQSIAAILVLLLLIVFLWAMRRKGLANLSFALTKGISKQKTMQILERLPLTPQHSLHLVRIQDRVVLLGVSPSGCTHLDTFTAAAMPVSAEVR